MAAPHPALVGFIRGEDFPPGFRVTMPVVSSADEHGLSPLLDAAVRERGLDGDHDALMHLTMRSLESAASTRAAIRALGTVVDASDELGLDLAVFKGLGISVRWYPSPELRPSVDVDVFVDPNSAGRLADLVGRFSPEPDSRKVVNEMIAEGRVFEYSIDVDGVDIDVHRDPMNMVVATRQQHLVWDRTEMIALPDGRTVRTLDLELSIVQALLHLFRDNSADLLHVYDIGLMIDADPDWGLVESFAATEGWTDLVRFSLGTACDTLGRRSPLPRDISPAGRLAIAALWPERIRLRGGESLARSDRRQSLTSFLIRGRRVDVSRSMLRRVFPPRSIIDDRHGESHSSYPVALYRWRRSQRDEIKRFRSRARRATSPGTDTSGSPTTTGASREAN